MLVEKDEEESRMPKIELTSISRNFPLGSVVPVTRVGFALNALHNNYLAVDLPIQTGSCLAKEWQIGMYPQAALHLPNGPGS